MVNVAVSEMARTTSVVELTDLYAGTQKFVLGCKYLSGQAPLLVHWQGLGLTGMRAVAGAVIISRGIYYYGNLLLSYFYFTL